MAYYVRFCAKAAQIHAEKLRGTCLVKSLVAVSTHKSDNKKFPGKSFTFFNAEIGLVLQADLTVVLLVSVMTNMVL